MSEINDARSVGGPAEVDHVIGRRGNGPPILLPLSYLGRGTVRLDRAVGVMTGPLPDDTARAVNGAALQAAFDEAHSSGRYVEDAGNRYEYRATASQGGRNTGLHLRKDARGLIGGGSGTRSGTHFVQHAANHPALTIGDVGPGGNDHSQGARYEGFATGFGAPQTGRTSADGLLLGRICYSSFDDILAGYRYLSGDHQPHVGLRIGASDAQFFFSNTIGRMEVQGGQQHILRQDANGTGCAWGSLYLGGGGFGRRHLLSAEAFHANMSGAEFGHVAQLNIEWCQARGLLRSEAVTMTVGHLHLEGNQLVGPAPTMIHAVAGGIDVRTLRALDNMISARPIDRASVAAGGAARVLYAYGDARITIGQASLRWGGPRYHAEAVADAALRLYDEDASRAGRWPHVEVGPLDLSGHAGAFHLDANLPGAPPAAAGAIASLGAYRYGRALSTTEGASISMADASLTAYGAHRNARITAATPLTAPRTLTLSDRLAASGAGAAVPRAPGDVVHLHRAAGGAFDLAVVGHDAARLGSARAAGTELAFVWTGSAWVAL